MLVLVLRLILGLKQGTRSEWEWWRGLESIGVVDEKVGREKWVCIGVVNRWFEYFVGVEVHGFEVEGVG